MALSGKTLSGKFGSKRGDVFNYQIKPNGKLSYSLANRADGDKDDCGKGVQCGLACVARGSVCEQAMSPTARQMAQMAVKTMATEQIPSRQEISKLAGTAVAEFWRNPIKFTRQASQRERLVMNALEEAGFEMPEFSGMSWDGMEKISKAATDYAVNNSAVLEDLAVNTAGFVSSKVGAATAGPVGALAGDLGGALVVRKGIDDTKVLLKVSKSLADDEAFKKANALQKAGIIHKRSKAELAAMKEAREQNFAADVTGWAIGNTAAEALNALGVGIPLKGAAVAMPTTPEVVAGYNRLKAGEDRVQVFKDVVRNIASIPKKAINAGNERERKAREKLNAKIRGFNQQKLEQAKNAVGNRKEGT